MEFGEKDPPGNPGNRKHFFKPIQKYVLMPNLGTSWIFRFLDFFNHFVKQADPRLSCVTPFHPYHFTFRRPALTSAFLRPRSRTKTKTHAVHLCSRQLGRPCRPLDAG
jgi:hypothetical protein